MPNSPDGHARGVMPPTRRGAAGGRRAARDAVVEAGAPAGSSSAARPPPPSTPRWHEQRQRREQRSVAEARRAAGQATAPASKNGSSRRERPRLPAVLSATDEAPIEVPITQNNETPTASTGRRPSHTRNGTRKMPPPTPKEPPTTPTTKLPRAVRPPAPWRVDRPWRHKSTSRSGVPRARLPPPRHGQGFSTRAHGARRRPRSLVARRRPRFEHDSSRWRRQWLDFMRGAEGRHLHP